MIPVSYAYSISNTTNAASVDERTGYISTMYSSVLVAETTFGRTLSPSASTVTSGTTKGILNLWVHTW